MENCDKILKINVKGDKIQLTITFIVSIVFFVLSFFLGVVGLMFAIGFLIISLILIYLTFVGYPKIIIINDEDNTIIFRSLYKRVLERKIVSLCRVVQEGILNNWSFLFHGDNDIKIYFSEKEFNKLLQMLDYIANRRRELLNDDKAYIGLKYVLVKERRI